jgi:hypothetical protein
MLKAVAGLVSLLVVAALPGSAAAQSNGPRRIKNADIGKLFSGREFSDEIHWAERYDKNGILEGSGSGRRYTKRWAVKDGQLCITDDEGEDCREVWIAGPRVELRRWSDDEVPKTGILRTPRR